MSPSPWKSRLFVEMLAVQAAALTAAPAFGGISVLSDDRSIAISGQAKQVSPNPPPQFDLGPAFSHSAAATPLAAFNQSLADSSNIDGATLSQASASQTSSFQVSANQLVFNASGNASYSSGNSLTTALTGNSYFFTFTIDATTSYTVSEQFGMDGSGSPDIGGSLTNTGAALLSGAKSGLNFADMRDGSLIPFGATYGFGPKTFTGTLVPGQYTFEGFASGTMSNDGGNVSYGVDLTLTQSDSSTTPPAAAVPLPPAAWMGLGTIGLIVGGMARRRRAIK